MATRFHSAAVRVNGKTLRGFRRDLVRWYHRHKRDLPWRRTDDPYKIWISEIMLQQTRVDVVCDYYERWVRALPTVQALARAPYARVLKLWEGLGYYSRARNLHRAAGTVVRQFREHLPESAQELQALPGIGPYTSAAIASIAFGERVPVVDGNVARVLARVFLIRADVTKPATLKQLTTLALAIMPKSNPGDFNQAMMELGALVCTPAIPRCESCPIRRVCAAYSAGVTGQLPNRGRKAPAKRVAIDVALVRQGRRVLLRRRVDHGLLAGMWELPAMDEKRFNPGAVLFELRHTITNRRITMRIFDCRLKRRFTLIEGWRWVDRWSAQSLSMPAAQRRAVERCFSAPAQSRSKAF